MKKLISLMISVVLLIGSVNVFAETTTEDLRYTSEAGDVFSYEYSEDGTGVYIVTHRGLSSTDLVYPDTIDGLPVVRVCGENLRNRVKSITLPKYCKEIALFGGEENLETVILNEGLEEIGSRAFINCVDLKTINLPSSLTKIGDTAFSGCTSLENIELPPNIATIEASTFLDCTSLTSIEIPSEVTQIGASAFRGCTSLEDVKFNEGLVRIDASAFSKCAISSIEFPESLIRLGINSFANNKKLKQVTIPENVVKIEKGAFTKCGLEKVTLHNRIETMELYAFHCPDTLREVEGLSDELIAEFWTAFDETPWQKSLINDDNPFIITKAGKLVAYVGTSKDIVIPDTVKVIGEYAVTGVESVVIPNTVTEIERCAFYGADLTAVTIPASVINIGEMAFSNCRKLKDITFEAGDKTLNLGLASFQDCAVTTDSLVTNGRRYTNKTTAFKNTVFDPYFENYVPIGTEQPTEEPEQTEEPTTEPTVEPTEIATENPTSAPAEQSVLKVISKDGDITVEVDGKEVDFGDEYPFVDNNGRTQIPIRAVAEAFGCEVDWNDYAYVATLTKGDRKVIIKLNSKYMQVGNDITGYETIIMDTIAQIVNDRTYIPVRFAGEALGLKVEWVNR